MRTMWIAAGDVTGMVLAVATIVALRYRMRATLAIVCVLLVETALDLVNSTIAGMYEHLFTTAANVTWLILTFTFRCFG